MTYRIIEDEQSIEFRLYRYEDTNQYCESHNYNNYTLSIWFDKSNRTFNFWVNDESGYGIECAEFTSKQFESILNQFERRYDPDKDYEYFFGHDLFTQDYQPSMVKLYVVDSNAWLCDYSDLEYVAEDFYYIMQRVRELINQTK